jgi:hypothetical protein
VGPLTALVNNASVFEKDAIHTMTRASWDKHIETNLRAPLVLAQNFAEQMPAGAEGSIVNLLDQRMLKPTPQFLSYGVSKAGLHWLTVTLAQALAPRIPSTRSPRSDAEERAPERCLFQTPASSHDSAAARRKDRGRHTIFAEARGDRSDDRGRRRPASRLAHSRRQWVE